LELLRQEKRDEEIRSDADAEGETDPVHEAHFFACNATVIRYRSQVAATSTMPSPIMRMSKLFTTQPRKVFEA
jgi:hypothetical protein